jgi:hypothetical protein
MVLVGNRLTLIANRADIGKLLKNQFKNQVVNALGLSNLLLEPSTERLEFVIDTIDGRVDFAVDPINRCIDLAVQSSNGILGDAECPPEL